MTPAAVRLRKVILDQAERGRRRAAGPGAASLTASVTCFGNTARYTGRPGRMGDLFDGYAPADPSGSRPGTRCSRRPACPARPPGPSTTPCRPWRPTTSSARCAARDRSFRDRGITFQLSGEERPFPLDLVPRIIPEDEWTVLAAGVAQRVRALEAFLADVYGRGQILADRVVPRRLVTTSAALPSGGLRAVEPPNGVRIHVAGIDVVRGADGPVLRPRGQHPLPVRGVLRDREPPHDGPDLPGAVRQPPGAARRRVPRASCSSRCGPPRPKGSAIRPWWCSPPGSTTRPTSSIRSWPARWGSNWSRAGT